MSGNKELQTAELDDTSLDVSDRLSILTRNDDFDSVSAHLADGDFRGTAGVNSSPDRSHHLVHDIGRQGLGGVVVNHTEDHVGTTSEVDPQSEPGTNTFSAH